MPTKKISSAAPKDVARVQLTKNKEGWGFEIDVTIENDPDRVIVEALRLAEILEKAVGDAPGWSAAKNNQDELIKSLVKARASDISVRRKG